MFGVCKNVSINYWLQKGIHFIAIFSLIRFIALTRGFAAFYLDVGYMIEAFNDFHQIEPNI